MRLSTCPISYSSGNFKSQEWAFIPRVMQIIKSCWSWENRRVENEVRNNLGVLFRTRHRPGSLPCLCMYEAGEG